MEKATRVYRIKTRAFPSDGFPQERRVQQAEATRTWRCALSIPLRVEGETRCCGPVRVTFTNTQRIDSSRLICCCCSPYSLSKHLMHGVNTGEQLQRIWEGIQLRLVLSPELFTSRHDTAHWSKVLPCEAVYHDRESEP